MTAELNVLRTLLDSELACDPHSSVVHSECLITSYHLFGAALLRSENPTNFPPALHCIRQAEMISARASESLITGPLLSLNQDLTCALLLNDKVKMASKLLTRNFKLLRRHLHISSPTAIHELLVELQNHIVIRQHNLGPFFRKFTFDLIWDSYIADALCEIERFEKAASIYLKNMRGYLIAWESAEHPNVTNMGLGLARALRGMDKRETSVTLLTIVIGSYRENEVGGEGGGGGGGGSDFEVALTYAAKERALGLCLWRGKRSDQALMKTRATNSMNIALLMTATKLTQSNLLTRFIRFALASLIMRLASLGAAALYSLKKEHGSLIRSLSLAQTAFETFRQLTEGRRRRKLGGRRRGKKGSVRGISGRGGIAGGWEGVGEMERWKLLLSRDVLMIKLMLDEEQQGWVHELNGNEEEEKGTGEEEVTTWEGIWSQFSRSGSSEKLNNPERAWMT